MGSSASKGARAATRKYPTTPSLAASQTKPQPPPPAQPPRPAEEGRGEEIDRDGRDPDFARFLRSIGPVQPNPTLSPSSQAGPHGKAFDPMSNPAVVMLKARARIQQEAEEEQQQTEQGHGQGRKYLVAEELRQMLVLRDVHRKSAAEIERTMGLKTGVVDKLGGNIVQLAQL
ncbi:hypothetical protein K470DRAFT_255002 [Piedraia hortae CBS 480.64]|uniref:Helix-turn-helix domain-containing protein n=1 Tax=Piedraia hortae CBS 480.64 TaxID=1314780 RepID=A0A6A7C7D9_9PEZI|nr:hypothetical protein K470DRAFT_255002 [Piedraia hortae CBS 480.64]